MTVLHGEGRVKSETLAGVRHKAGPLLVFRHSPREKTRARTKLRALIKASWCNPTRLKLEPVTGANLALGEGAIPEHRPYFAPVYGLLGNLICAYDAWTSIIRRRGVFPGQIFFTRPSKKKIIPAPSRGFVYPWQRNHVSEAVDFALFPRVLYTRVTLLNLIHPFFIYY